jgi:hypothetical protein
MAKLFKTISLEDRWKDSIYSRSPITPSTKDQGDIQLKQTPNAAEKNSAILKSLVGPDKINTIPTIVPIIPKSNLAVPFANTKYRSAINLEDRLKQPNIGSTNHLAQYFLSDQHTNFIKIRPFEVLDHTSNTILNSVATNIAQGDSGTLIPPSVPRTPTSNTIINTPVADKITYQGVIISNGQYQSVVTPDTVTPLGGIAQSANITTTTPKSEASLGILQGMVIDNAGALKGPINVNETITLPKEIPSSIITATPVTIPLTVPASIAIVNPKPTSDQGGTEGQPITFEPNRTSPTLNVLGYAADSGLALFAPMAKHGSSDISNNVTKDGSTYFQDSGITFAEQRTALQQSQRNVLVLGDETNLNTVYSGLAESTEAATFTKPADGVYTNTKYKASDGILHTPNDTNAAYAKALGSADGGDIPSQLSIKNPSNNIDPIKLNSADLANNDYSKISLSDYSTLTYDQLVDRSDKKDGGETLQDFRIGLSGLKYGNGTAVKVVSTPTNLMTNARGVTKGDRLYENDFITLSVHSLRDGTTIVFRAFITSFSDSTNISWTDINYIGRQDTLKAFKGVTRGGSIAFKVVALYDTDLGYNYDKLNSLIQIAALGGSAAGNTYINGPICELTVGRWFKDTPVIFNTAKYDVQMADYSWDIDKQMPQIVDVSLDFVVLGDTTGAPLNSTGNHFNYIG